MDSEEDSESCVNVRVRVRNRLDLNWMVALGVDSLNGQLGVFVFERRRGKPRWWWTRAWMIGSLGVGLRQSVVTMVVEKGKAVMYFRIYRHNYSPHLFLSFRILFLSFPFFNSQYNGRGNRRFRSLLQQICKVLKMNSACDQHEYREGEKNAPLLPRTNASP